MNERRKSPAELRSIFGSNLRFLANAYPSISELARQLGINRTQFNRYLSGESFPRPDVLARICEFFDVDARILLEPVQELAENDHDSLCSPFLRDFMGPGAKDVPQSVFPSGFYQFSRRSFLEPDQFLVGLVWVFRRYDATYLRGYEAVTAMGMQGLPGTPRAREFRGLVLQQEEGVAVLVSRRGTLTGSFNFLSRVSSFENNFWVGYVTRTMRDASGENRVARMVYEYLGPGIGRARDAAKSAGYCAENDLAPFHKRLLQVNRPFS